MTMQLTNGQLPNHLMTDAAWMLSLQASSNEIQSRDAFSALMWALSYPGRCYSLLTNQRPTNGLTPTQQSCLFIGEALLDLETTFYTPDRELGRALTRASGRWSDAQTATYHFYPDAYYFYPELASLDSPQANLASVRYARTGSMLYPDQSATLIIGCEFGRGGRLLLAGPGIPGRSTLFVAGVPQIFWQLRAQTLRYPLGWDIFLVDGDQVVGLPRTTMITYTGI
jgi:alpha-D-ribose 1-methylphosphonate 5-triphosphate synthase subunit PhnH